MTPTEALGRACGGKMDVLARPRWPDEKNNNPPRMRHPQLDSPEYSLKEPVMSIQVAPIEVAPPELAIRTDDRNLNHHLWNNNGTWFIHYTVYPTPVTKQRIRRSLHTKSLVEAREHRDGILSTYRGGIRS